MNNKLKIVELEEIEYNNTSAIRNLIMSLKREMNLMRRCYRKAELRFSIIPTLEKYLSDLELHNEE